MIIMEEFPYNYNINSAKKPDAIPKTGLKSI